MKRIPSRGHERNGKPGDSTTGVTVLLTSVDIINLNID